MIYWIFVFADILAFFHLIFQILPFPILIIVSLIILIKSFLSFSSLDLLTFFLGLIDIFVLLALWNIFGFNFQITLVLLVKIFISLFPLFK